MHESGTLCDLLAGVVHRAPLAAHDDGRGAEPLRDELPVHGPGRQEGGDGDPAGAGTDI